MATNRDTTMAPRPAVQLEQLTNAAPLRIAIVSDFLEEQWPSMDLIADMLVDVLPNVSPEGTIATQLRPAMRRGFTRLPVLGHHTSARNADRLLNRFFHYPRWLESRARDFDVFHLVDHSYSQLIHFLPRDRSVVTCHDLDTFRCLIEPGRERRPGWFRAMTRRILNGFRQAGHIIAVSEATREELLRFDLAPPERISVIPNGVHPSCSPSPHPNADSVVSRLIPLESGDSNLLLSVGSTLPRKRLDVLLHVFAAVRRALPELRLVRVGGFTASQMELSRKLGVDRAVVNLPFLERDVLAALYRRATLLLQPSEAEGFGLPVIEAMACGCPVIASDLPVLREVGRSAAAYCPVADVDAWSRMVIQFLEEKSLSRSAWELRRERGLKLAARYSWSENARQTAAVYRKVAGK